MLQRTPRRGRAERGAGLAGLAGALACMAVRTRRLVRPLPLSALLLIALLASPALGSPAPAPGGAPAPQTIPGDGIYPETGYRIGDPPDGGDRG